MRLSRALAIPAAVAVLLTIVGAWLDGSESASSGSLASTSATAPDPSMPTSTPAAVDASASTTIAAPPTSAASATATSCTQVVHIGDSTSVGLTSPDYIQDPALRIDAQYARVGVTEFRDEIKGARSIVERFHGEENADDVAGRQKASGYEGCWVLALGTTDAANMAAGGVLTAGERIDRMFATIGDDPVLWVDVKTLGPGTDEWGNVHMVEWNQALVNAQARYPNLAIYDWASVVQDAWFQQDHIHYTSAGNVERARLIADALVAAYPA